MYSNFSIRFSGTVALCSLLTGSVISRFYSPTLASSVLGANETDSLVRNATAEATDPNDPIEIELPSHVKIAIASSLCLLVGLVQVRSLLARDENFNTMYFQTDF